MIPITNHNIYVSFIGDLAHTPPDDVLLVDQDGDYVHVCQLISTGKPSGDSYKVWVRSKIHFSWLRQFIEQIGFPCDFKEETASLLLAERWNVWLPTWLTDEDILEQDLLQIIVDPQQEQTNFSNRLLTHLLGAVFQADSLNATILVDVVKVLVNDNAKAAFRRYPVLHRCLEEKCKKWSSGSNEAWVKDISNRLYINADEVWQWLSLWACLHNYPEKLLEYVLAPEQVLIVRRIPAEAVYDLPLEPIAKEQVLNQIELLLEKMQTQVTSNNEFQKLVKWTSGRLSQEYYYVSKILRSNLFSPTIDDVHLVQSRFRNCLDVPESKLASLGYCVMPPRPTKLGSAEEWSSLDWIRWTTEEYAPYRAWQVHNGYYDKELEETIVRFSEWFVEEYTSIHKDPNLSLVHSLSILSVSGSEDDLSIILLVDCLPVSFLSLLDDTLRNVGFSRHDLHYRFAALPSVTEYNKPVLLSGDWQIASGSYEAILKARSQTDWCNRQVVYLNSLKALSEIPVPQTGAVVLLNLGDGDELLHSDVESKNSSFEEELHRLFARMTESVSNLSKAWAGPRERISLYVVTDHGACRILEKEKQSFDSQIVNKLFSDERHRFAAVAADQMNDIPANMWAFGIKFKQPFVSDGNIYFLPKGHNTVRQSGSARGYQHGGVTPEEVIVPTAVYKLVKAAWKRPNARFLDLDLVKESGRAKFYIQRVVALKLEVQNPNTADISILRATVISPETDIKSIELTVVPSGSAETILLNCYFKKEALNEKSLELEIAYEISGEQHVIFLTLECDFKSAMVGGFSLKDL